MDVFWALLLCVHFLTAVKGNSTLFLVQTGSFVQNAFWRCCVFILNSSSVCMCVKLTYFNVVSDFAVFQGFNIVIQVLKRVSSPPRSFQSRCVPSACCISCPDSDICLRVKRSQGCLGVNQLVSELKNDSSFSHFFGPNSTFNFYKSRSSVIVCESHSLPRTLNYNTLLY